MKNAKPMSEQRFCDQPSADVNKNKQTNECLKMFSFCVLGGAHPPSLLYNLELNFLSV